MKNSDDISRKDVNGEEKLLSYRTKLKSYNQIKAALVNQEQMNASMQTTSDHRKSGDVFIID